MNHIHKYYPIGIPYLREDFSGYQKLQEILKNESNIRQNDYKNSKWNLFIESINSEGYLSKVEDFSINGLPSQIASVEYGSDQIYEDEFQKSTRIYISKSLLSNYYTIYFESKISFLKLKEFKNPIFQTTIFGLENSSDEQKELYSSIISKMQTYFPDCEFVPHDLLMNTLVKGGIPIGQETGGNLHGYSIFSFLFGHMHYGDIKVIK